MKRRDFLSATTGALGASLLAACTDFADNANFDAAIPDGEVPLDSGNSDTSPADDAAMAMDSGAEDSGVEDAGMDMDSGPEDAGMAMMCVSVTFSVGSDHMAPHAEGRSFPADDVTIGEERTYDIQGASGHPHTLVVTPAHFAMLAAGESVTITSSRDAGHTHDVTLQCMSA